MKILRILLQTVDTFISGIFRKEGVAIYLAQQNFNKPARVNEDIVKQRKAFIKSVSMQQLGIALTDQDIDNAARTISIR